jgi:cellulose biosynthesis protein BcsQ
MSTIIFTAGAKGGTGKSTAVRLLITYLRAQGFNPALLDMDDESKTLSRFFPEAQKVNIREPFSHNILVKKALSGEKLVIADLKGGTGESRLKEQ